MLEAYSKPFSDLLVSLPKLLEYGVFGFSLAIILIFLIPYTILIIYALKGRTDPRKSGVIQGIPKVFLWMLFFVFIVYIIEKVYSPSAKISVMIDPWDREKIESKIGKEALGKFRIQTRNIGKKSDLPYEQSGITVDVSDNSDVRCSVTPYMEKIDDLIVQNREITERMKNNQTYYMGKGHQKSFGPGVGNE